MSRMLRVFQEKRKWKSRSKSLHKGFKYKYSGRWSRMLSHSCASINRPFAIISIPPQRSRQSNAPQQKYGPLAGSIGWPKEPNLYIPHMLLLAFNQHIHCLFVFSFRMQQMFPTGFGRASKNKTRPFSSNNNNPLTPVLSAFGFGCGWWALVLNRLAFCSCTWLVGHFHTHFLDLVFDF